MSTTQYSENRLLKTLLATEYRPSTKLTKLEAMERRVMKNPNLVRLELAGKEDGPPFDLRGSASEVYPLFLGPIS